MAAMLGVMKSMKAAKAAQDNFNDPTKGANVPAGREGAPVILFDCTKKEAYTPSKGYKQLFRRLRSTFQPKPLKEAITPESISEADILVFAAPREKFTTGEFDALEDFVNNGGSILWLVSEGGEPKMGTNINYLLEKYKISVNKDCVVRTVHQKYFHPKEALISDGVLNRAINSYGNKSSSSASNPSMTQSMDSFSGVKEEQTLSFVMPFGATLMVEKPATAILSSGKIAYPMHRPVGAVWQGKGSEGRIVVLGSAAMAEDEWLDKEDNAKVIDFCLRWLTQNSGIKLNDLDSEEPDVNEYTHLPDTEALAERLRCCLQEGEDLPKDFTQLFDSTLFKFDTSLIPEALELYAKLNVKKAPLSLIAPQFDTPLPPLQPAVFPPTLKEPPPPALDLFDLEEEFASEKTRLAKLFSKCQEGTDEDVEYFVRQGAQILGIQPEAGKESGDTGKALLSQIFQKVVQFKMRAPIANDYGGGMTLAHDARLDRIDAELAGMDMV